WRTAVGGGYVNVDYNGTATNIINARLPGAGPANCGVVAAGATLATFTPALGNSCNPDYSFWEAYTRTQWNPVPQLDIRSAGDVHPQQHRLQRPGGVGGERLASRRGQRHHRRPERLVRDVPLAAQLLSMI